jgi:hypothetical protein
MEDKLAGLERANFDLKMRIYYLNNKLAEAEQGGYLEDSAEKVVNLLQQRDSTSEKLTAENAASSRRISELETELNLVKTKLESNMKTRDFNVSKARDSSVLQMEENLKRERQAALAVAQHDSSVIIQLEAEIKKLTQRHDSDLLLISDASEKCAKLLTTIGEKDRDVERKAEALLLAKQHSEALQEKLKSQDLQLSELTGRLQASFEQRRGDSSATRSAIHASSGAFPSSPSRFPSPGRAMPPPAMPPPVGGMSLGGMGGGHASVGWAHSPSAGPGGADSLHNDMHSSVGDAATASPKPAPKLGAPHMSASSGGAGAGVGGHATQRSTAFLSASAGSGEGPSSHAGAGHSTGHSAGHSTGHSDGPGMHSYHRSLRDKYFESQSTLGAGAPSLHQPTPIGQTAEMVRAEILQVRSENNSLKQQLETERGAIRDLQGVLDQVRTAAEEITLLEAEEIARLEAEVESMQKEKTALMESARRNQGTIEQLRVKSFQLETQLNEIENQKSQSMYRNSGSGGGSGGGSALRNRRQQSPERQGQASSGGRYTSKSGSGSGSNGSFSRGGGGGRMGNSFDNEDGYSNDIDGAASHAYGGHGDKFIPSPNLPTTKSGDSSSQPQQVVIDMYRYSLLLFIFVFVLYFRKVKYLFLFFSNHYF